MYCLAISFNTKPTTNYTYTFSIVDGKKQHAKIVETDGKIKLEYALDDFNLTTVKIYLRTCKRYHGATSWTYREVRKGNNF